MIRSEGLVAAVRATTKWTARMRRTSILFPLRLLPHVPAVLRVLSEAAAGAIPEAVEDGLALDVPRGFLQMTTRVGHMRQMHQGHPCRRARRLVFRAW